MTNEHLPIGEGLLWEALRSRNSDFDGVFYFGVKTTGIFCRPSCASRSPRAENVTFFRSTEDAERAGFRACLRCKPSSEGVAAAASSRLIGRALEIIGNPENEIGSVEDLAADLDVSSGHLQKTFGAILGISPKEALDQMRISRFKKNTKLMDITSSLYESGYGSSRALYEKAGETLGMTPATYKKGGKGITVTYALADTRVGKLLAATTEKGICAVSFGDNSAELERDLRTEFFAATVKRDDAGLADVIGAIGKSLEGERAILDLPLDVRASAFQMRVWSELRKIPFGETRSYGDIARSIGKPAAVRAVARACATNPAALVTPCHRVIGAGGKLSGYRWGIERKDQILRREREIANVARSAARSGGRG